MTFEWDDEKAATNADNHGVSFDEAATVFVDPLYLIFADPDHSIEEGRFLIVGESAERRLLIVSYTQREDSIRLISAREATRTERNAMKKTFDDDMRPEYDLSKLTLVAKGTGRRNKGETMEIAPDVAKVFPTADAVNEALRFLIRIGKAAQGS